MEITILQSDPGADNWATNAEFVYIAFGFSIFFLLGLVGYHWSLKRFPITDFYSKKASTYILINTCVRVLTGTALFTWFIVARAGLLTDRMKTWLADANLFRTILLFELPFYLVQMSLVQISFASYSFYISIKDLMGLESVDDIKERQLLEQSYEKGYELRM